MGQRDHHLDAQSWCSSNTCRGGVTLSLDLERAFDSVPWSVLEEWLIEFGVPSDIISLILFLHEHARYTFSLSAETTYVQPQQGLRHVACDLDAVFTAPRQTAEAGFPEFAADLLCKGLAATMGVLNCSAIFLHPFSCSGAKACGSVSVKPSSCIHGGAAAYRTLPGLTCSRFRTKGIFGLPWAQTRKFACPWLIRTNT